MIFSDGCFINLLHYIKPITTRCSPLIPPENITKLKVFYASRGIKRCYTASVFVFNFFLMAVLVHYELFCKFYFHVFFFQFYFYFYFFLVFLYLFFLIFLFFISFLFLVILLLFSFILFFTVVTMCHSKPDFT